MWVPGACGPLILVCLNCLLCGTCGELVQRQATEHHSENPSTRSNCKHTLLDRRDISGFHISAHASYVGGCMQDSPKHNPTFPIRHRHPLHSLSDDRLLPVDGRRCSQHTPPRSRHLQLRCSLQHNQYQFGFDEYQRGSSNVVPPWEWVTLLACHQHTLPLPAIHCHGS